MPTSQPENIWIIDTTLRDGEQTPGVLFPLKEKITISKMLVNAGVNELEAGIPAMGPEVRKELIAINRLELPCRITGWCRAVKSDIKFAEQCGLDSVHISFPISERQLNVFGKDKKWVLNCIEDILPMACNIFPFVSIGAQDATRCDEDSLIEFIQMAYELGAYRVRIADTVGGSNPSGIFRLVKKIKTASEVEIEFHGHNDLGLATANALSAAEAGASSISVTINGLGERSGNVALEQAAVALSMSGKFNTSIKTSHLMTLCSYIAEISGRPIPPDKPIAGSGAFIHESGIHCAGLLKDPLSYQPFLPESIGQKGFGFVLGRHSGSHSIKYMLGKAGIDISRDEAMRLKEVLSHEIN